MLKNNIIIGTDYWCLYHNGFFLETISAKCIDKRAKYCHVLTQNGKILKIRYEDLFLTKQEADEKNTRRIQLRKEQIKKELEEVRKIFDSEEI